MSYDNFKAELVLARIDYFPFSFLDVLWCFLKCRRPAEIVFEDAFKLGYEAALRNLEHINITELPKDKE